MCAVPGELDTTWALELSKYEGARACDQADRFRDEIVGQLAEPLLGDGGIRWGGRPLKAAA
ncbi:hypothetical protein ACIPW9_36645 [Streptomyces sp. NPDC090052]|uniref:hypothetical protein n=1 Tax=Streptomyces sp. NPDC090052 TaxID=3365931 RepID=UPI00382A55D4